MAVLADLRPTDLNSADPDLVSGVRAGDDRAFEILYARYQPRITQYVRGMVRDHGRAEDITQEVFLSALRRIRSTDAEIVFKPWIYEIAKNACIDAFRRARHTNEVSFDVRDALSSGEQDQLTDIRTAPDIAIDAKLDLDNLRSAFGGLSDTHHQILVMRELEGLSYRDIGDRLGMSRPAVESTLFRARRRLEEEYDQLVSGARCVRVRAIIDGGGRALGVRDQRRLDRHISHCQPCRRHALSAGLDLDARPARLSVAARIAALVPLPVLWRRSGAEWSANVASTMDPAAIAGWGKAIFAAATVAVAGVGAGAAVTEREAFRDFFNRGAALVPATPGAGSSTSERGGAPGRHGQERVSAGKTPSAGGARDADATAQPGSAAGHGPGGAATPYQPAAPTTHPPGEPAKQPPAGGAGAPAAPGGAVDGLVDTLDGVSGPDSGTPGSSSGASDLDTTVQNLTGQVGNAISNLSGPQGSESSSGDSGSGSAADVVDGIASPVTSVVSATLEGT